MHKGCDDTARRKVSSTKARFVFWFPLRRLIPRALAVKTTSKRS